MELPKENMPCRELLSPQFRTSASRRALKTALLFMAGVNSPIKMILR